MKIRYKNGNNDEMNIDTQLNKNKNEDEHEK